MTSPTSVPHLPALGHHERNAIGNELQATLVSLLDLALVGKQLHWSVTGRLFRPLHLQLDELVASWLELADTVAERQVALGEFPDGQAATIAARGGRDLVAVGPIRGAEVAREITQRIAVAAEEARERMDRLGDLDAASQDVLTDVVRALEEQLWMMRAQLDGD